MNFLFKIFTAFANFFLLFFKLNRKRKITKSKIVIRRKQLKLLNKSSFKILSIFRLFVLSSKNFILIFIKTYLKDLCI